MRIDSHHHLWRYNPQDFDWIDEPMQVLRRDFLPEDLAEEAARAGIDATIAVQARQSLTETQWLLELAAGSPLIQGVVGWAPIAGVDFPEVLEAIRPNALLKGLRHVVQGEAEGFLDDPAFNRGIAAMLPTGLVYDILIFARQLSEATRFVDRHPDQVFVLDHIAKPDIAQGGYDVWNAAIRELARRSNVNCKLSGMVTEADWHTWTAEQLQPYFDTAVEAFGPNRLMFGSDWPVMKVASSYTRWAETVDGWLSPLSRAERGAIEGDSAARVYHLQARTR